MTNQIIFWGSPKHQPFIKATAIESSTIPRLMRSGWGGRSCGIDPPCKVAGCQKSMCCCCWWCWYWWDKPETRKATGRCGGKSSLTYQLLWDNSVEWRHSFYLKCFLQVTVEIDESSPDERVENFPISDQLLWLSSAMTHSALRNKANIYRMNVKRKWDKTVKEVEKKQRLTSCFTIYVRNRHWMSVTCEQFQNNC